MNVQTTLRAHATSADRPKVTIADLVGAGHKIARVVAPFAVVGIPLNIWRPEYFSVGGPADALRALSIAMLAGGIVIWLWSVVLILTRVPRHELITSGPFRLMKHPLYTGVSLFVLPWLGFLLNTWLGLVIGIVIYLASRAYAVDEELVLAAEFGREWDAYADSVVFPWM